MENLSSITDLYLEGAGVRGTFFEISLEQNEKRSFVACQFNEIIGFRIWSDKNTIKCHPRINTPTNRFPTFPNQAFSRSVVHSNYYRTRSSQEIIKSGQWQKG